MQIFFCFSFILFLFYSFPPRFDRFCHFDHFDRFLDFTVPFPTHSRSNPDPIPIDNYFYLVLFTYLFRCDFLILSSVLPWPYISLDRRLTVA